MAEPSTATGPDEPHLADTVVHEGDVLRTTLEPLGEPETIGALLGRNAARLGNRTIFREKKEGSLQDLTWDEFLLKVVSFGTFLRSRGIETGDRVAVYSRNRGELLITEFAVMSIGAVHTPIFAGYPIDQMCDLLLRSGARALVVADLESLAGARFPEEIELVVSCSPSLAPGIEAGQSGIEADQSGVEVGQSGAGAVLPGYGEELIDFESALAEDPISGSSDRHVAEFLEEATALDPDEVSLLMYTSGTSGELKGVLLTHDNILSQQRALARLWAISPDDRLLSYLPWHHSFGGIFEKYVALYNGAVITIDESYGKDFPLLLENFKAIQPTVYFSVPKVYQELFNHVNTHPEDESQVFHDGLRFVFTAAAPLPANISAYFAEKEIPVAEGWGLTETAPCCTVTDLHERREIPGMVGYPIPGVSLKLSESGEILVRGPNVMKGYDGNPEQTTRVLPGDGWFRTGDLGEFVDNGLVLVSREDRVFKLLNAEKIIPTRLENELAGRCAYIRHVIVVGSGQDSVAALIFPNFFLISQEFGDDREKAEKVVKKEFRQAVLALNDENPVKYEHIKAFAVVSDELTVEDGKLTPSMKVRVTDVLKDSEEYVEALFEPSQECDCSFLSKVMRLDPDDRHCFYGKDMTLDRCHECRSFVFEQL
jgi:long-subunit acyl-CoA synthetase (AMP-forming)